MTLRHVARPFIRNRSYTIAAVLTMAVGLAATTAVIAVTNAVLLRPYPRPDGLYRLNASPVDRVENHHRPASADALAHLSDDRFVGARTRHVLDARMHRHTLSPADVDGDDVAPAEQIENGCQVQRASCESAPVKAPRSWPNSSLSSSASGSAAQLMGTNGPRARALYDLPESFAEGSHEDASARGYHARVAAQKRAIIGEAFDGNGGNVAAAARDLELQVTCLRRLIRNLGVR